MNRQVHLALWDQQRLRHGITLRLLEQIPDDQLTRHPIAGMRTPVELVVHMYATVESMADGVHSGTAQSVDEKPIVDGIKTKAQLRQFVTKAWAQGDKQALSATEPQLGSPVKTPWGDTFPGHAMFGIIADEYLHHRGQLYAFVRTYGTEPVMVWDFEHNAAEYQPRTVPA